MECLLRMVIFLKYFVRSTLHYNKYFTDDDTRKCEESADCPEKKTCLAKECVDPCQDICGEKAFCRVEDHMPICNCDYGFEGNPYLKCSALENTNSK